MLRFIFPGIETFVGWLVGFGLFSYSFSCVEKSLRTFWFLNVPHNELNEWKVQFQ